MTTTRAADLRRSSREPEQLRHDLERWLSHQLERDVSVPAISATDSNGMSSDTVLFDAITDDGSGVHEDRLAARLAPAEGDVPVFPTYDLQLQFGLMRLVAESTVVPVPQVRWYEPDPEWVGSPMLVMSRVDGRVPPDNLPYTFGDNWLADASKDERRTLQDATADAIAELHGIPDPAARLPGLRRQVPGETALRRHVEHTRNWYLMVAADGCPSPLVESCFDWLDAHWPDEGGPDVLSWGDARIGNVIYDGFSPAALLDWEMAGIGPAELDVAWLICAHLVFQDLAVGLGMPGLPDFMQPADVIARYENRRGVRLGALEFFLAYAALQWAIVFLRTGRRASRFSGRPLPSDVEQLILCRPTIERLVGGAGS